MRTVQRNEIVDYMTYQETREAFQKDVFAAKERRRIHLSDCFTFLFENSLTIRYQIQEMMRAEKMVKEKDIKHELETYNAILGDRGELGCTFMIELQDPKERDARLREWIDLPNHIYAELQDGTKIYAQFDSAQIGSDRLSSVQYLKFAVNGMTPAALGIDLPACEAKTFLTDEQRVALHEDLQGSA
jgi:hypothetical protein